MGLHVWQDAGFRQQASSAGQNVAVVDRDAVIDSAQEVVCEPAQDPVHFEKTYPGAGCAVRFTFVPKV